MKAVTISKNLINPMTPTRMGYAPDSMYSPNLVQRADVKEFELNEKQRGDLITAKSQHRRELQRVYGTAWKRHLNIPEKSIGKPIKNQF